MGSNGLIVDKDTSVPADDTRVEHTPELEDSENTSVQKLELVDSASLNSQHNSCTDDEDEEGEAYANADCTLPGAIDQWMTM